MKRFFYESINIGFMMKINRLIIYTLILSLTIGGCTRDKNAESPSQTAFNPSFKNMYTKIDYSRFKSPSPSAKPGRPPIRNFVIEPVPAKGIKPEWDTFDILVWQFKTHVEQHHELWKAVGCRGFHIDRGGRKEDAEWAQKLIFYQDHAAGKGYLYLRENEFKNADSGYGTRVNLFNHGGWVHPRPRALTDPQIIKMMYDEFQTNVIQLKNTRRMLIAFDDEISLGKFISPHEVCGHPNSIAEFQEWLRWRYNDDIHALNKQWGTDKPSIFMVMGEKHKLPYGSFLDLIRKKYSGRFDTFKKEHGEYWKLDLLRLSGKKMFEDLPPQVFFHPYKDFNDIPAISFEWVRKNKYTPFREWNLSMWADFRGYMDYQFSNVLKELTSLGNQLDPDCPCGFVGAQAPSAWGGYNYSQLIKVVQWIEAYDVGGTNEVIRGLNPDIIRAHTYFPPKDWKSCCWFMSYYLAHQNKCLIMWPASAQNSLFSKKGKKGVDGIDDRLKKAAPYTKVIIEEPSRQILSSQLKTDPIAVYFSQPSIRVAWALDVDCHGNSWPARSGSVDNYANSYHQTLVTWFKILEDLGFQYIVINEEQLFQGRLNHENIRVLILPKALALSRNEVEAFSAFVEAGGTLIADHMSGLFDEHGKGLADNAMPVTELFGVIRDSSKGWFDGTEICELNGEIGFGHEGDYDLLLSVHKKAKKYMGVPVVENGLFASHAETVNRTAVMVTRSLGKGKAIFMNLSVLPYMDMDQRITGSGIQIRRIVGNMLEEADLKPEVLVYEDHDICPITEQIVFEKPDKGYLLCIIKNPTRQGENGKLNHIPGIPDEPIDVTIRFEYPIKNVIDIIAGKSMNVGEDAKSLIMNWKPWEMILLSFEKRNDVISTYKFSDFIQSSKKKMSIKK